MDKTALIKARDEYKGTSGKISFITDNPRIYSETTDTIIWDDTNGVVHVVRTNDSYREAATKPFILETLSYDAIQYVMCGVAIQRMREILSGFVTDGILTEERRQEIINHFLPLDTTHMPSPGTNA